MPRRPHAADISARAHSATMTATSDRSRAEPTTEPAPDRRGGRIGWVRHVGGAAAHRARRGRHPPGPARRPRPPQPVRPARLVPAVARRGPAGARAARRRGDRGPAPALAVRRRAARGRPRRRGAAAAADRARPAPDRGPAAHGRRVQHLRGRGRHRRGRRAHHGRAPRPRGAPRGGNPVRAKAGPADRTARIPALLVSSGRAARRPGCHRAGLRRAGRRRRPVRRHALPRTSRSPAAASESCGSSPTTRVAPVPVLIPQWRVDLARLAQWCAGPTPAIVAGDLNATLDHSALRAGANGCGDAGEQRGGGLVSTWGPSPRTRVLGPQIDHVLMTTGIAAESFEVRSIPGSDHRAIVSRLRLPG